MYRVAQVSILGPIRFLLHVKVLPGFVQCVQLDPYADEAWLFDNSLVLNTAKTCYVISFQLKYVDKPNNMYNNTVTEYTRSPNINFLGITVAENLKVMPCMGMPFRFSYIMCRASILNHSYFVCRVIWYYILVNRWS